MLAWPVCSSAAEWVGWSLSCLPILVAAWSLCGVGGAQSNCLAWFWVGCCVRMAKLRVLARYLCGLAVAQGRQNAVRSSVLVCPSLCMVCAGLGAPAQANDCSAAEVRVGLGKLAHSSFVWGAT